MDDLDVAAHKRRVEKSLERRNIGSDTNLPTLRDRFAMAALPAVIAAVCEGHISPRPNVAPTEIIAEQAFKVADAMIAEGNKK